VQPDDEAATVQPDDEAGSWVLAGPEGNEFRATPGHS
jgi:hypothetical protein